MMFAKNFYLPFLFILFYYLTFTETTKIAVNHTTINSTSTINMTLHENVTSIITTTTAAARKTLFIQGQEFIHKGLNKIDRNTLVWSTIAIASITALISIYIAMKTFILRKKHQTRRYKLLSNATTMEEPLFNEHNDDEEDRDDDTLFVRR